MTLSNKSKGATQIATQYTKEPLTEHQARTIKLHEIIDEIVEDTRLNKTEAVSVVAMMINTIKEHLTKCCNVNLGELGTLSVCTQLTDDDDTERDVDKDNIKDIKIIFTPSLNLKLELKEKVQLNRKKNNGKQ